MPHSIIRTALGVVISVLALPAHAAAPAWLVGLAGVSAKGRGVDVLIIGDGVDYLHPTLGGEVDADAWNDNDPDVIDATFPTTVIDGWDFAGANGTADGDPFVEGPLAIDGAVHASTAAAAIIHALAPEAKIKVFKVTDAQGKVSLSALKAALERAKTDRIPVVMLGIPMNVDGDLAEVQAAIELLDSPDTVVIAPAGDAGRAIFSIAWVNRWANVLTVAATAPPGVPTVTLDIETPATVAGRFGLAPITPAISVAGEIELWACDTETGTKPIGLVIDASCLAAIAPRAAAAGVDALLVAAPPGLVEVFEPDVDGLPMLALDHAVAARLAVSLAAGSPVSVSIDDALSADLRLVDTVSHLSSRGPWRDSLGLRAEPELSAPGQHMLLPVAGPAGASAEQSGTTLAAAYVAGVAALLIEQHGDWDATHIKARLIGASAPSWSAPRPLSGGNPSLGGAGGKSPLTIGGAGRVDAQRALRGGLLVYLEESNRAVADLGVVTATEYATPGKRLVIHNGSAAKVDLTFEPDFRDASDVQGGVTIVVDPPTLTLEPGQSASAVATFSIHPDKLRELASRPTTTTLGSYDPTAAWTADEVDGAIRLVPTTEGTLEVPVSLPFWLVPRSLASTAVSGDTCLAPEAFELGLTNTTAASQSELFTLLADDLGARTIVEGGELLQVAVVTPGAVAITIDGDGVAPWDHVVLAAPEQVFTGGLATGRELAVVLTPTTSEGSDTIQLPFGRFALGERRLVITEPLAPARIVTASYAALGITGATRFAVTPFPATALATDFVAYDPACGYPLQHPSIQVRGDVPLVLESLPTCATPARGLLALHFGNAADKLVERIVPPTTASYTCDPAVLDIADPETCTATTDFRPYVHGNCATVATVHPVDESPRGLGTHAVELSISDPWGNTTTCQTSLEVSDGAPPEVDCGEIAAGFSAGMLPLDHVATATDTCGGTATVEVVGYRCLVIQNGEITYERDEGCGAALDGANMHVVAVDSPANLFEWSVLATDSIGNEIVERCYAAVDRAEVGAKGGGGCAGGGTGVWVLVGALGVLRGRRRRGT